MKKSIILGGLAVAMLSGCVSMSNHRAPANAPVMGHSPAPKAIVVVDDRFTSVEGKAFYIFKPDFTCTAPMPGAPAVSSWLDKVEVIEGKLIRWGTRCNGEGLPLTPAEDASAKLSDDGLTLTIGGVLYHRSGQPTKKTETPQ